MSDDSWNIDPKELYEYMRSRKYGDPNAPTPTWEELVAAEPKLGEIMLEARKIRPPEEWFCGNRVWYETGGLRDQMSRLVGWDAEGDNVVVHGPDDYEVAYDAIYYSFPGCNHPDEDCSWT